MKKYLLILIALCLTISLTACGKNDNEESEGVEKKQTSEPENNEPVEETIDSNPSDNFEDYELYSDDTKYVFKKGAVYMIYYYSGKKVTAYHTYTDYGTEEEANIALAEFEKDKTMKKVYVKGQYLVIEYAESEYKDLNAIEIRSLYSDIEQVLDKG